MLQDFFAAADEATDIGADLHIKFSARLRGQHGVVADNVAHFEFSQIEAASDLLNNLIAEKSNFVLCIKKSGHERRPLRRIVRHHLRKPRLEFFGEFHKKIERSSDRVIVQLNLMPRSSLFAGT